MGSTFDTDENQTFPHTISNHIHHNLQNNGRHTLYHIFFSRKKKKKKKKKKKRKRRKEQQEKRKRKIFFKNTLIINFYRKRKQEVNTFACAFLQWRFWILPVRKQFLAHSEKITHFQFLFIVHWCIIFSWYCWWSSRIPWRRTCNS